MNKLEKNIKKFLIANLNRLNGKIILDNFWTSKKPINGLRHFVLVNENEEKGNMIFLMVSVVDSEINLKITSKELLNSGNWHKGWINLPKIESITKEYGNYKTSKKLKETDKIFVNDNSSFNIT